MSREIARFTSKGLLNPRDARVIERTSLGEHVDYVVRLRSGLGTPKEEGTFPCKTKEEALKIGEDWCTNGTKPTLPPQPVCKRPEQLTLKGVREARRIAMLEQIVPAKQPKETPSHTPANASFFWELRGIADPTCFHFASKHLAIESLEVTYADEVAEQKFDIKWGHQNMSAVIDIKGIGCYTLTLKLAQTIFTTPIHLQRHKDL